MAKQSCFNHYFRYTPGFLVIENAVRKMLFILKGVIHGKTVYRNIVCEEVVPYAIRWYEVGNAGGF